MKKAGKRILALGVTLGIICGIGGTAFAAEKLTVTINGSKATCLSTINASDTASAYTTYNGNGAVSVKATYTTKNLPTGEVHKTTRTKATYGTASVTINKPKGDISKRIESEHSVSVSNQTWKGKTIKKSWYDQ